MYVNSNWVDAQKTSQEKNEPLCVGGDEQPPHPAPPPPSDKALWFINEGRGMLLQNKVQSK